MTYSPDIRSAMILSVAASLAVYGASDAMLPLAAIAPAGLFIAGALRAPRAWKLALPILLFSIVFAVVSWWGPSGMRYAAAIRSGARIFFSTLPGIALLGVFDATTLSRGVSWILVGIPGAHRLGIPMMISVALFQFPLLLQRWRDLRLAYLARTPHRRLPLRGVVPLTVSLVLAALQAADDLAAALEARGYRGRVAYPLPKPQAGFFLCLNFSAVLLAGSICSRLIR